MVAMLHAGFTSKKGRQAPPPSTTIPRQPPLQPQLQPPPPAKAFDDDHHCRCHHHHPHSPLTPSSSPRPSDENHLCGCPLDLDPDGPRYKILKCVGQGAFGRVHLTHWHDDFDVCGLVALKSVSKRTAVANKQTSYCHNELAALRALAGHPFIVRLHAAFQTEAHVHLALEWCQGGNLLGLLRRYGGLKASVARFYLAEVYSALSHMHSKGMIYRDLKPENVVIDADGHVRLVDFGLVFLSGFNNSPTPHPSKTLQPQPTSTSAPQHGHAPCQCRAGPPPSPPQLGSLHAIGHGHGNTSDVSTMQPRVPISIPLEPLMSPTPAATVPGLLSGGPTELRSSLDDSDSPRSSSASTAASTAIGRDSCDSASTPLEGADGALADGLQPPRAYTICGSDDYLAPEVLRREGCDWTADLWGLGCLGYELLTGGPPFRSESGSRSEMYASIVACDYTYDYPSAHRCPEAQEFVIGLLKTDPDQRLGAGTRTAHGCEESGEGCPAPAWSHERLRTGRRQVKCHPFFAGVDHDMLTSRRIPPPFVPRESGRGEADTSFFTKKWTSAPAEMPPRGHPHRGGPTPSFYGFEQF